MPNQSFPSIPELRVKTDVLSSDSTCKISSIQWYVGSDGVAVDLTSAVFGSSGQAWGVFEPRTSRQEFFRWTVSTIADATTTGITIAARGLPWGSDYATEDSTRKFSHPAGSKVLLFTDYGGFWNTFANKGNTETITAIWTYSATPVITNAPSGNTDAANKAYVDGVAVAGAPNANTTTKGIVEIATGAELAAGTGTGGTGAAVVPAGSSFTNTSSGAADANKIAVLGASGEIAQGFLDTARTIGAVYSFTADRCQITSDADSANDAVRQSYLASEVSLFRASGTSGEAITAGQPVYLKASDGKLWRTDADADESTYSFVGFAINTTAGANLTQYYTRAGGIATGLSGLTAGLYYFLSGTTGGVASTPHATRPAKVGQALSTTTMRVIEPKFLQSGTFDISGTGDTTLTVGFYPTKITMTGVLPSATRGNLNVLTNTNGSRMWWDGTNVQASSLTDNAFTFIDAGGTTSASLSSRTATTFVVNCSAKASTANPRIIWTAESM